MESIFVVYCVDRFFVKLFLFEFKFVGELLFDYLNDKLGIYIVYVIFDIIFMFVEKNNVYKKFDFEKNDVVFLFD